MTSWVAIHDPRHRGQQRGSLRVPASSGWPRRPNWWSASLVRRHRLSGINRVVLGRGDVAGSARRLGATRSARCRRAIWDTVRCARDPIRSPIRARGCRSHAAGWRGCSVAARMSGRPCLHAVTSLVVIASEGSAEMGRSPCQRLLAEDHPGGLRVRSTLDAGQFKE